MFFKKTNANKAHISLPCPICGAVGSHPILCPVVLAGTDPTYELVDCQECHTRFLNPFPTTDSLNRFYAPHYYGSDWYKHEGKGRMFGRTMLPRGEPGKFLDVGCSLGFFLIGVGRSSGWQPYGVEISGEAVAFARERLGLDVQCGELQEIGYPDHFFNYIHVNNVLEHVRDPLSHLRECRRIIRPGGYLYLSVPNGPVDSANLVKYFQIEQQPPRSKDGHLFFFSQKALLRMFQSSKFEIVAAHTYGLRRGLRALGRYPQKPGWKRPYRPQIVAPTHQGIHLPPAPKRFPGYDAYRFRQARLKMLPGLWGFGLDFEIILQAI